MWEMHYKLKNSMVMKMMKNALTKAITYRRDHIFMQGERGMDGPQGIMGPPGTGIQGKQVNVPQKTTVPTFD